MLSKKRRGVFQPFFSTTFLFSWLIAPREVSSPPCFCIRLPHPKCSPAQQPGGLSTRRRIEERLATGRGPERVAANRVPVGVLSRLSDEAALLFQETWAGISLYPCCRFVSSDLSSVPSGGEK